MNQQTFFSTCHFPMEKKNTSNPESPAQLRCPRTPHRHSTHSQVRILQAEMSKKNTILQTKQQPVRTELDVSPALEEVTVAIGWLESRKGLLVDGIQKHVISVLHAKRHEIFVAL